MAANGDVNITIADGGSAVAVVPAAQVQLVIGCSSAGTIAAPLATSNPNTLVANLGFGPLPEAAALVCQAGGTAIAMRCTSNAAGVAGAVQFVGTGTSVITASGAPYDDLYVRFLCVGPGTIGTAGITFQISLDAGRNYGPVLALGTAVTYAIPNTGLTLAFAAGTLVAGDTAQVRCTAPQWNTAGIQACLNAFQASQYGVQGVGSIHIVGPCSGATAATLQTYLETLATGHIYGRAIVDVRDANAPNAWTGTTTESETVWVNSVALDFSTTSARRICAAAGHYNMPSAYSNPAAGSPRYRRSLGYALAAREVTIPPQRHAGRVRDGNLSQIVIDAINDPQDGFVYHDERILAGLDAARFASARTRVKKNGFYIVNPNLMSPLGSQFTFLPHGNVIDIASDITYDKGQDEVNDDVRQNPNGTIFETDAKHLENEINLSLAAQMVNPRMVSSASFVVDRSWNVGATNKVQGTLSVLPRPFVLEVDVTIAFQLPNQAG